MTSQSLHLQVTCIWELLYLEVITGKRFQFFIHPQIALKIYQMQE